MLFAKKLRSLGPRRSSPNGSDPSVPDFKSLLKAESCPNERQQVNAFLGGINRVSLAHVENVKQALFFGNCIDCLSLIHI